MWKNYKNKIALLLPLLMPLSPTMAMQALDDDNLSATTGQDGLNVGIQLPKLDIGQVALIDNDGISSKIIDKDYTQAASLTLAGTSNTPVSISFLGNNSASTINAVIDTDAGAGKPFANIAMSFGTGITGIKISPFALYLANTNETSGVGKSKDVFRYSGASSLSTGVTKFLDVGNESNNFQINFVSGNAPKLNIQLGDVPQSHMIQFSGAIQSICGTGTGCPIRLISSDTAAKFDLQMNATNASTGFLLNNFYAGVESNGVVFGNSGTTSKMNVALNNLTLGNAGATSPDVFNGIANGSMGSFGAIGASVKDLKVSIRGF